VRSSLSCGDVQQCAVTPELSKTSDAQTVIARVPFLNRLRNSYDKTVNIALLGGIFQLVRTLPCPSF
jgi:hypothetical protein